MTTTQTSSRPPKKKHGGRRTTPRSKHHPTEPTEQTWATEPVFCRRSSRLYFERRLMDADGGLQR